MSDFDLERPRLSDLLDSGEVLDLTPFIHLAPGSRAYFVPGSRGRREQLARELAEAGREVRDSDPMADPYFPAKMARVEHLERTLREESEPSAEEHRG